MVTQITLGNFSVQNGRNVLFGVGGSGLDTASLIAALIQARSAPVAALQQKISQNAQVTSALNQFQQLSSQLQTAVNALRNPPGVGNAADNAFAYNSASITANKSVAGTSYVSVTAAPGTALQNYTITNIASLAAIQKQSTGTFVIADADTAGLVVASGATSGQFKAGTFTIDSANGPAVDITLDASDTLNSIAQKFNNAATATGISASVVKISDGNFKLVFSSLYSGTDYAVDLNDTATTVTDPDGVLDQIINGSGEFTEIATTQEAADADFYLDGNHIVRSTNSINDLVTGLTFNLLQATPTGEAMGEETEITIAISPDTNVARNGIISFINAYNDLRSFAVQQTQTNSDGTYASTALLANNTLFRSTMNTLISKVTSVVSGLTSGDPNKLTDIGITFTSAPATATSPAVPNVLTVDEGVLQSALSADFAKVRKVFEFTLTSDNTNLRVFSRTNALGVTDFTLKVNPFATQSVTLTPRASATTSTITVADADTAIVFDSPDPTQLGSGTITVGGEDILLEDGDTLNDVITKFNAVSEDSGVKAHLIEVAAGQFQIAFTSPEAIDFEDIGVDPDGVFDNFTFTDATGADASIAFSSNPDSGGFGVGTVTVNGETIDIEEGDSLNDIVAKFAAAAGDSDLSVSLDDLGDGQYELVFTGAYSSTSVNYNLKSSSVDPDGVFDNITLAIEGVFQATYNLGAGDVTIDLDGEAVSNGAAHRVTGVDGTVLEGLVLIYGSSATGEIDVTATQGLGDRIYNDSYDLLKADGALSVEFTSIDDRDTQIGKDIERLNGQIASYRDRLLRQFGALEAALFQVNSLLTSLDAQAQARRNASG